MTKEAEIQYCRRQITMLTKVVIGMEADGLKDSALYLETFFKVWLWAQRLEALMFLNPENRLDLSGEEIRMN